MGTNRSTDQTGDERQPHQFGTGHFSGSLESPTLSLPHTGWDSTRKSAERRPIIPNWPNMTPVDAFLLIINKL
jgi:hypothetical protein